MEAKLQVQRRANCHCSRYLSPIRGSIRRLHSDCGFVQRSQFFILTYFTNDMRKSNTKCVQPDVGFEIDIKLVSQLKWKKRKLKRSNVYYSDQLSIPWMFRFSFFACNSFFPCSLYASHCFIIDHFTMFFSNFISSIIKSINGTHTHTNHSEHNTSAEKTSLTDAKQPSTVAKATNNNKKLCDRQRVKYMTNFGI